MCGGQTTPKAMAKQNGCHLRWSKITKLVETKDTSTGLIKSSISDSKKSGKKAGNDESSNYSGVAQDLSTAVESNKKVIINQVSGQANPSQVLAIMGPSGSGKTSLLNVLATRSVYEDGTVSLNEKVMTNHPARIKSLKRKIAYIKQDDIFFNHLTVKDQLTYTAFLRLGDDMSKEAKREEVDRVIKLLRLEKCADTPISLISGGERKRTNIGTELLTQPSLVLLDEPTSGLDSSSAVALMSLLGTLAHDHGKTIITSIHQPTSAMFHNFDRVLFLADGCTVYYGPPSESLSYMHDLGYTCPNGYNAADHWMDLLVEDSAIPEKSTKDGNLSLTYHSLDGVDEENPTIENGNLTSMETSNNVTNAESHTAPVPTSDNKGSASLSKSILSLMKSKKDTLSPLALAEKKRAEYANGTTSKARLITMWDIDSAAQRIDQDLEKAMLNDDNCDSSIGTTLDVHLTEKKFNTSWWTQFKVLLHRSMKNSRSAILTPINLVKSICLALLVGLLWFQLEDTERIVADRASYAFFTITFWIFEGTFSALFGFPAERAIIFKERASGSYHLSAYFMAKTLSEMPTRLILPLLFISVTFWMTAANSSFVVFLGVCGCALLGVLAGESIGLFVGALIMDFEKAMTVLIVFTLTCLVSGGYYIQNIPAFMSWTPYLSPFKYAYHSSVTLIFDHNVPCDGSGILEVICSKPGVDFATPEEIREFLNVEGSVGMNVGLMFVMIFVARYLAFLALKSKKAGDRD